MAAQNNLIEQLHDIGCKSGCKVGANTIRNQIGARPSVRTGGSFCTFVLSLLNRQHLGHRNVMKGMQQIGEHRRKVNAPLIKFRRARQHRFGVPRGQGIQHGRDFIASGNTQHARHRTFFQRPTTEGNRLVSHAKCVTHTTRRRGTNDAQSACIKGDSFRRERIRQIAADAINRHVLQLKLQTARQDRNRNLFRFSGGQQKFDVGWGLFENF